MAPGAGLRPKREIGGGFSMKPRPSREGAGHLDKQRYWLGPMKKVSRLFLALLTALATVLLFTVPALADETQYPKQKVVLIGASGNVGSRLLRELTERGHEVTAVARNPEKIARLPGVTPVKGDALDPEGLAKILQGHDAVISAVRFSTTDPQKIVDAVRSSGVKRYLVVGGAGSLLDGSGKRVIDSPDFPKAYLPEASKGAEFLDLLRTVTDLEWTFLSPSAEFFPGQRTGQFRLGTDHLLVNEAGSRISYEDYAVALVNELEVPAHIRQRFTVGY